MSAPPFLHFIIGVDTDINDSNAANAEEVAAAAEEMSATMHTVASGAGETAAKGLELKELVEKFKLAPHGM